MCDLSKLTAEINSFLVLAHTMNSSVSLMVDFTIEVSVRLPFSISLSPCQRSVSSKAYSSALTPRLSQGDGNDSSNFLMSNSFIVPQKLLETQDSVPIPVPVPVPVPATGAGLVWATAVPVTLIVPGA